MPLFSLEGHDAEFDGRSTDFSYPPDTQQMTIRYFLLIVATMGIGQSTAMPQSDAPQAHSNSALGALSILPPDYQAFVVKLSADDGNPDPAQWYVLAYRGSPEGGLFSITIAHGELVQLKPSLNLGELFRNPNPIAVERIAIDSPDAFQIAHGLAAANGKDLGAVSYVLQQTGEEATPVWQIWCYDPTGRYFGYVAIAATDGSVISTEGLSLSR
jgi:hypothetical protein